VRTIKKLPHRLTQGGEMRKKLLKEAKGEGKFDSAHKRCALKKNQYERKLQRNSQLAKVSNLKTEIRTETKIRGARPSGRKGELNNLLLVEGSFVAGKVPKRLSRRAGIARSQSAQARGST